MKKVVIIGGGLAGLISALELTTKGLEVILIEKKNYPFHRVCGEYVSQEVLPFLKKRNYLPDFELPIIQRLKVSSPNGNLLSTPLKMGGFGISRYALDGYLAQKAQEKGVLLISGVSVQKVDFLEDSFQILLSDGKNLEAGIVLGAFGKRSNLDKYLNRNFFEQKSPYIGVKYHIRADFPKDLIALHNFQGGYCGISAVEYETYNLCYLAERSLLKKYGTIPEMEKAVLFENPHLQDIFTNSTFLWAQPLVINEISFLPKPCVENHVLMVGDAAGMITPLCGNGMAMAIHSALIASKLVIKYFEEHWKREVLEKHYQTEWTKTFAQRLWIGRNLQKLFGNKLLTEIAVGFLKPTPSLTKWLISKTHGKEIVLE
ncbi:MAG: NAD(P)/FAD-dependent oxidoreductase [Bacteroidia bacterium]